MTKKTPKQLDREIATALAKSAPQIDDDTKAEAAALRELEEMRAQRLARSAAPKAVRSDDYAGQLRYWNDYAVSWGKPAAIERATKNVAGAFLSRDFGESAESFYARSPAARATRDWLHTARATGLR